MATSTLSPASIPVRTTAGKTLPRPRRLQQETALRIVFWTVGLALATVQAWVYRFQVSADSISYLDMSDAVMPGRDWHRLITGTWSPLYPFILGCFRRLFRISPGNEIAAGHYLNLLFFVFAFVCFEVLLRKLRHPLGMDAFSSESGRSLFPQWAFLTLAYSVFLWASISAISLEKLRPDMLMSGFVYLAAALLLDMRGRARWGRYLQMGVLLGVAFLAKAPMLPIGFVVLALTLFIVEDWRPALRMAAASAALIFLIGSLYFVPLSVMRGHFTLGESGGFNYLVHVDGAGPRWYMEDPGAGAGKFLHPPQVISAAPLVYAFKVKGSVTHPLRFDPAVWMSGARPRINVRRQAKVILDDLYFLKLICLPMFVLAVAVLVLAFVSPTRYVRGNARMVWPLCLLGIAGLAMYLIIHVESRYVGVFLALSACAVLSLFVDIPAKVNKYVLVAGTALVALSLLAPVAVELTHSYRQLGKEPNRDRNAAVALESLGIRPGDAVARISDFVDDLGIERIARVGVVSEVDLAEVSQFWSDPPEKQTQILSLFAKQGVKAVIATSPQLTEADKQQWVHLAHGRYWAWLPPQG